MPPPHFSLTQWHTAGIDARLGRCCVVDDQGLGRDVLRAVALKIETVPLDLDAFGGEETDCVGLRTPSTVVTRCTGDRAT